MKVLETFIPRNHCAVCRKPARSRCSKCKVVNYCCREHQQQDFPNHKHPCSSFGKWMIVMREEEEYLRTEPEGGLPFLNSVGKFWFDRETREYMSARSRVIDALDVLSTAEAMEYAVDHVFDCLRLCTSDNLGMRFLVTGYLLLLDRDQECYDFIKWWITCDPEGPLLNLHGCNCLEPMYKTDLKSVFGLSVFSLQHLTCLWLVKFRVLQTLQDMLAFDTFLLGTRSRSRSCAKAPLKHLAIDLCVLFNIRAFLPHSNAVPSKSQVGSLEDSIAEISNQLQCLRRDIDRHNPHFVVFMSNPSLLADYPKPRSYSKGSKEEAYLAMENLLRVFRYTGGSVTAFIAEGHLK